MAGVDELREEFGKKRKELSTLRSKLSEVHSQKEEAFRQLRSLRDEAAKNMSQIREIQSQRDALTKEVSERKNERNKLNDTFKEKAAGRKDAERKNVQLRPGAGQKLPSLDQKHSKQDLNLNPSKLRAEIKRLEDLIETEVMSFEKEKELRKKVKGLKAAYQKVEQGKLAWKAVHAASADLAEARRKEAPRARPGGARSAPGRKRREGKGRCVYNRGGGEKKKRHHPPQAREKN